MQSKHQASKLLYFLPILLGLVSCKTTYENAFEHNIPNLGVDIRQHQLEYQISGEGLFQEPQNLQIDRFDSVFLNQLVKQIRQRGYPLNQMGEVQTMYLSHCMIDFNRSEKLPYVYKEDTFQISRMVATLACEAKTDSTRFFFATGDFRNEFEVLPYSDWKNKRTDSLGWSQSPNYYYRELQAGDNLNQQLGKQLAKNTLAKIDSSQKSYLYRAYPQIVSYQYKKTSGGDSLNLGKILLLGLLSAAIYLFL